MLFFFSAGLPFSKKAGYSNSDGPDTTGTPEYVDVNNMVLSNRGAEEIPKWTRKMLCYILTNQCMLFAQHPQGSVVYTYCTLVSQRECKNV